MLRKITLSALVAWLLWLGLLILLANFNKYSWTDSPMLNCDTDAEAAVTLFIWLVWITSAGLLVWMGAAKRKPGNNLETFVLLIALLISTGSLFKYSALLEYEASIAMQCE